MGLSIQYIAPYLLSEPVMDYDYSIQSGHLNLPRVSDRTQICRWVFHELVELALGLDLWSEPWIYPVEWGTHHDLAVAVEELHFGPRLPGFNGVSE